MAVENTVFLNEKEIEKFMEKYYNMKKNNALRVQEGSANCYKIENGKGVFFLKEFQQKFDTEAVENEIRINKIIESFDIPTSKFIISDIRNCHVVTYKKHCFHLQNFIDGYVFERNTVTEDLLLDEAEMLGKIHIALRNVPDIADGFPDNWFLRWTPDQSIKKHENVIEHVRSSDINIESKEKIIMACDKKIDLLKKYNDDYLNFLKLQQVNSHGDYNNQQIIYDKNKTQIKAIIDFSSVARVPAVWEIIRSYSYGATECKYGQDICYIKLKKYIDHYLKYCELSEFDISNIAGFYYYNLLRSTYGLNSQNNKLLEFALWRTQLCVYLSEIYKDIDMYLTKEYT